jgi:hypothetical protein
MARAKPKPAPADAPRSIAHHLEAAGTNQAHAARHIAAAKTSKTPSAKAFNLEHAAHHAKEATAKVADATEAISKKVPAVGTELRRLAQAKPNQVPGKKRGAK